MKVHACSWMLSCHWCCWRREKTQCDPIADLYLARRFVPSPNEMLPQSDSPDKEADKLMSRGGTSQDSVWFYLTYISHESTHMRIAIRPIRQLHLSRPCFSGAIKMSDKQEQIVLYDLASKPPQKCWSLNPWKSMFCSSVRGSVWSSIARFLLNYKGLDYRTEWVRRAHPKPGTLRGN